MNGLPFLPVFLLLLLILPASAELPAGVTLQRDIAYGSDSAQRFDVYLPPYPQHAPILFMVHGGAWRIGDKTNERVVDNKVAHWAPKGIIFVSVNYRMIPEAEPLVQAEDVARALAKVQELAPGWGGDPGNVILMGRQGRGSAHGSQPWRDQQAARAARRLYESHR
jgi:arylformamidase